MDVDLWALETEAHHQGYRTIAGVDEAGRGPLAGPVVAAAVVLPGACYDMGLDDSKKLSARRRERLYAAIYRRARAVGIGIVDALGDRPDQHPQRFPGAPWPWRWPT